MSNYFADVSSSNGPVNTGAYRSGSLRPIALMVKATEDRHYVNPYYERTVVEAHRHGLAVFHYHFARPESGNPFGQMIHFWDTVRPHFHRPGDYIIIDLETDAPRIGAAWLREADSHLIKISDTHPCCYTFLSYFEEGEVTINSKRMHIAAWGNSRPGNAFWKLPYGMKLFAWQSTDGVHGPQPHAMAGISGTCDVSVLSPVVARSIRRQKGIK